MQILNLDQYAEVKRQVTLKGVSHDVEEISVQDFINNYAAAEKLEKSAASNDEDSLKAGLELSIAAVRASVPTLDDATVRNLKMPQLSALLQFIRGELDPAVVSAPTAAAGDTPAETEGADAKKST